MSSIKECQDDRLKLQEEISAFIQDKVNTFLSNHPGVSIEQINIQHRLRILKTGERQKLYDASVGIRI